MANEKSMIQSKKQWCHLEIVGIFSTERGGSNTTELQQIMSGAVSLLVLSHNNWPSEQNREGVTI